MTMRLSLNPLVMGLCFYLIADKNTAKTACLNPLVMGLCFYQQAQNEKEIMEAS